MAIPTSNMAKVTDLAFIKIDADSLKSLKTSRSDLTKLCNLVTKWSNLVSHKLVQKPDYNYGFIVTLQYRFLSVEENVDAFAKIVNDNNDNITTKVSSTEVEI